MGREFRLPDIGEGLTEAEIVRWLVAEGESVKADQPIVEVETDKAVVEIPSPYAGVVERHGGAEGETLEVGSILVVISDANDMSQDQSAATPPPPIAAPIVGTLVEEAEVIEVTPEPTPATERAVKALPVVRKLARDAGLDLETVEGTGTGRSDHP